MTIREDTIERFDQLHTRCMEAIEREKSLLTDYSPDAVAAFQRASDVVFECLRERNDILLRLAILK